MAAHRDRQIGELLDEAQRCGRCASASDRLLREALDRRVGTELVRPRPRLYARTSYWNGLSRRSREEHILRGLAALHPDWTFCSASAALLHGLPVSYRQLKSAHILDPASHTSCAGVTRHRQRSTQPSPARARGVRVTPLTDTIVDCLLALNFKEGLAVADAALSRLQMSVPELDALLAEKGRRRPGVRQARKTAQHADARSESGGESMARAVMIENGFMLPELQVPIENPDRPGWPWRTDFYWLLPNGTTVAGELDGGEKYVNPNMTHGQDALQVLRDERIRESQLTLAVDRVMRFTFADVIDERRLVALLERFGIPRIG